MIQETLLLLKPDARQRGPVGTILSRFEEQEELEITEIQTVFPTMELLEKHYEEHVEKDFFDPLVDYMMEDEIFAVRLTGPLAVEQARLLVGNTDRSEAKPGTIRGDHGIDSFAEAHAEN